MASSMDRKGWPWKKKLSDKVASLLEASEPAKDSGEQETRRLSCNFAETPTTLTSSHGDPNLKATTDQLSAAMSNTSVKDELVQQHMKIAEEAVTGWEKAETQVVTLKEKLEGALQQKLATEDRVSHLDGALKECMKQLRHVREEQEQKLHDAVVKKTREWEKDQSDMGAKLADVTNQLCESLAENQVISRTLQERTKAVNEMMDTRTQLEAEKNVMQVQLDVVEKQNARFKYELHVLSKELELKNKEREHNKRAGETSSKQNLESMKQIAKLEEECHRLKVLVKKRLPANSTHGALSLTRSEVQVIEKDPSENQKRKRSPSRSTTSPPYVMHTEYMSGYSLDAENRFLSERLAAMEEETKLLKEMLVRKDGELQASRSMCAGKLPMAERQQDCHSFHGNSIVQASTDPIMASFPDKMRDVAGLELMDDFVEMEKLASLSSSEDVNVSLQTHANERPNGSNVFESAGQRCSELTEKLAAAEDQIQSLLEKQITSEVTVSKLQQLLAATAGGGGQMLCVSSVDDGMVECKIQEVKPLGCRDERTITLGPICTSEEASAHSNMVSNAGDGVQVCAGGHELAAAVGKVLDIVEGIALTDFNFAYSQCMGEHNSGNSTIDEHHGYDTVRAQGRSSGISECVESLIQLCQSLVQEKLDIVDFIAEVTSALHWLVSVVFSLSDKPSLRSFRQKHGRCCKVLTESDDSELTGVGNKGAQELQEKGDFEEIKVTESQDATADQSSVSNLSFQFSDTSHEEDLAKIMSEKVALQEKLEIEMGKVESLESEILWLKMDNEKLELNHKSALDKLVQLEYESREAKEKVQTLSEGLLECRSNLSSLELQLDGASSKQQSLERDRADLMSAKHILESQLQNATEHSKALENQVTALEEELKEETLRRQTLDLQYQELKQEQEQIDRERTWPTHKEGLSESMTSEELARSKKELEVTAAAEKLAECQQTIYVLGEQLKALGGPKEVRDTACSEQVVEFAGLQLPSKATANSCTTTTTSNSMHSRIHCDDQWHSESENGATGDLAKGGQIPFAWPAKERSWSKEEGCGLPNGRSTGRPEEPSSKGVASFPSPMHGENDSSYQELPVVASNGFASDLPAVMNSPLRSPGRFLSLKNGKNSRHHHQYRQQHPHSNGLEAPLEAASEKHSSAFSRFFSRTRSGH